MAARPKKRPPLEAVALDPSNAQSSEILDKRGYARRWGFSPRTCDNLIAQGLPHLKIGKRRVRIVTSEADAWMRAKFTVQRRGPVRFTTEAA